MNGAGDGLVMDAYFANGRIDAVVTALVDDAYAGSSTRFDVMSESTAPTRAQSTPDPDGENTGPGQINDPLDPKTTHRPNANEPLPIESPPVPKLRPLE